jgi:Na+/citrate or Na+/malate symporter
MTGLGTTSEDTTQSEAHARIMGIDWRLYLIFMALGIAAVYAEVIPVNVLSGIAITMLIGGGLYWIGDHIPGFAAVGGGPLTCIFVPATAAYLGALPESFIELVKTWFSEYGFIEVIIIGIIAGSILGMDRRFLLTAGVRILGIIAIGLAVTLALVSLIAAATGFGFREGLFGVAIPIMSGGISGGAIPLSQLYADANGGDDANILATIVPPIILGNLICIFIAAIYAFLTRRGTQLFVGFNGNGELVRVRANRGAVAATKPATQLTLETLACGLVFTGVLYIGGSALSALVPAVHLYAWVIILAALVKMTRVIPDEIQEATADWYSFVIKLWIPCIIFSVGVTVIDLGPVAELISNPSFLAMTVLTVITAAVATGFAGWVMRLNFIESSIAGGLGMCDLGGSGDIAVLGTARRIHLMPFLAIASRIGGGVVLLTASFLLAAFGGPST